MANPSKHIELSGWSGTQKTMGLTLTQVSQDPIANTSTVNWLLTVGGSNPVTSTKVSVYVGGNSVYSKTSTAASGQFPAVNGDTSGSVTVNHSADGTRSCALVLVGEVWDDNQGSYVQKQASDSLTLTTIDRAAPTVSVSVDNITANAFTVHVNTNKECDNFKATIGSTTTTFSGSGTSKSKVITGLSSNTNYSITAQARRTYNHVTGTSSATTGRTAGKSTISSAVSKTIGNACSISWTPHHLTQKFKLKFSLGSWSYTTDFISPSKQEQSYTYTGYTFPMTICNQLPNAIKGTATATLYTYNAEGTQIGTDSKTFTLSVPNSVVPTLTIDDLSDIGQTVFEDWLQNASIPRAQVSASGAYGSTMTSASITVGTQTASARFTDGTATVSLPEPIKVSGTVNVVVGVTDSRGRSATQTVQLTVEEYARPSITQMDLSEEDDTVTLSLAGAVYALTDNDKKLELKRIAVVSGEEETIIPEDDLEDYTFTLSIDDLPPELATTNYRYILTITDSIASTTKEAEIHPGRLDRFQTLDTEKYYTGFDVDGWKEPHISCEYDDVTGTVTVSRTSGTDPAGVGFPVRLEAGETYGISYGVDIQDENAIVFLSFFDPDFNLISTYDDSRHIQAGSYVDVPPGTMYGVLVVGIKGEGSKTYEDLSIRKYRGPAEEEIEWFLETGNLGLDTPNQKYISRIQLRIDYSGSLEIGIAYDNDEEYKTVHTSECDHMRSITVPIKVKRSDHFRIRLSGVGQMRLYSLGYDTDEGGARCLI